MKFHKVSTEELLGFANNGAILGMNDPNNTADLALIDYLQEHNDPREIIVRGDIKSREHPRGWMNGDEEQHKDKIGANSNFINSKEYGTQPNYITIDSYDNGNHIARWYLGQNFYKAYLNKEEHDNLVKELE